MNSEQVEPQQGFTSTCQMPPSTLEILNIFHLTQTRVNHNDSMKLLEDNDPLCGYVRENGDDGDGALVLLPVLRLYK